MRIPDPWTASLPKGRSGAATGSALRQVGHHVRWHSIIFSSQGEMACTYGVYSATMEYVQRIWAESTTMFVFTMC